MAHAHARVQVGPQGRLVIPADIRRELGIEAGDQLTARVEGRRLVLESPEDVLRALQDEVQAAAGGRSLVDELIAERRAEAARGDH
jgi:AbrB family looped-hinge helix DNA binding protein